MAARKQYDKEEGPREDSVHPRNSLNALTGAQWLYFTKTTITTAYPSEYGHKLRLQHGANKPPQLMRELIEFFTKPGERVLDPFAGVGGTLLGASLADPPRQAVGIEINPRWAEVYGEVLTQHPELAPQEMIVGDCREVMAKLEEGAFDFIATDPPYNIQLQPTMSGDRYPEHRNRHTDYNMRSEDERDLANLPDYAAYLEAMEGVFAACRRVLRPRRYLAVIVRNAYQKGEYLFTHADLARRAKAAGLVPKGEKVWYQAGTRLRPYGYPSAYVPNITHQFILIFRRED